MRLAEFCAKISEIQRKAFADSMHYFRQFCALFWVFNMDCILLKWVGSWKMILGCRGKSWKIFKEKCVNPGICVSFSYFE